MILTVAFLENDWLGKILYTIGSFFNSMVYKLISLISEGLLNVANTQMFTGGMEAFTKRIYVILGVYMLFKLAFSLLNSVINPDMLLDKERGMQKIIPRTIVMLLLLIMVPTIFSEALNLQAKIIPVIPKIIIGKTVDENVNNGANYGENIASMALGAFILKNDACSSTTNETLAGYKISDMLAEGTKVCDASPKLYAYDFNWFVAFIVGIVLAVVLFFYSIDVAMRLIKIGLLQLLAPIPIISYIDPKSSKDGAFASWLKLSISTYIDLFIKLAMFYFVIFILSSISDGESGFIAFPSVGIIQKSYITIMIVVAAVFFLMQAPKFIYGMLGIKSPSSGIGLSGALAGTAAFLGGAGLMGSLGAASQAMADSSTAAGQGKQAGSGWKRGSDLAAQWKTGDPKAEGGLIAGFNRKIAQNSQRNAAAKLGVTTGTIAQKKRAMELSQSALADAKNNLNRYEAAYNEALSDRNLDNDPNRDAIIGNLRQQYLDQKNTVAVAERDLEKTTKDYNDEKDVAKQFNLKDSFYDERRTTAGDIVRKIPYMANRVPNNPVTTVNQNRREKIAEKANERIDRRP